LFKYTYSREKTNFRSLIKSKKKDLSKEGQKKGLIPMAKIKINPLKNKLIYGLKKS